MCSAPRRPQTSPLYRVPADHFELLERVHEERFEPTHGPLRVARYYGAYATRRRVGWRRRGVVLVDASVRGGRVARAAGDWPALRARRHRCARRAVGGSRGGTASRFGLRRAEYGWSGASERA